MATPGLETYFEPEKRLAYTPERMAKLIRAVEKSDPPFKTIYSWSWRLRSIDSALEFAGSMSGFPSAGLTVHRFDTRPQLAAGPDWKHHLLSLMQMQRPATPKCVLTLSIRRDSSLHEPGVGWKAGRNCGLRFEVIRLENDESRNWRLNLDIAPFSAFEWVKGIVHKINPRCTFKEATEPCVLHHIFEGDRTIGYSTEPYISIECVNCSPQQLLEIIDVWTAAAEVHPDTPFKCSCNIYSNDKQGDITAEAQQMLARTGTLPATQTCVLTEFAVLSPEGLETLRQWPLTTNGKEFESGICYFARNQRQCGAISVATGANGQYIFFSAPGLKMKDEMEKLFGLKLKRVKRDDY